MTHRANKYGQPIGNALPDWAPCPRPDHTKLRGQYADVVMLDAVAHGDDLFAAFTTPSSGLWTYLSVGPFADRPSFDVFLAGIAASTDPLLYAIINTATGRAEGFASYLRITPDAGSLEIGYIAMSPMMQRTRIATEAMYLMMAHAFDDLGYRRYEWKCDSLNAPSVRAAKRYGFTPEGVFRQATVYKNRNRDTAWFSILDSEWPAIKTGFQTWLAPANFDDDGVQKTSLTTSIV